MLSGLWAGAALAGLALADATKRRVLREPLHALDGALLREVLRHPHLYLPFAGALPLAAGAALVLAGSLALAALEPSALGAAARLAALAAGAVLLLPPRATPPALLARDPAADAARLGPATTLLAHAAIARAERRRRQAEAAPADPPPALPERPPHLVLLQLESFWDARGRTPRPDAPALPGWDSLAAASLARGRLLVPGFGANTMRAEFAALTGLPEEALGLDALNPYAAFARRPVASLAHRLAAAGYATLALHPHDGRFFSRDNVLPALGFRRFEAEAAFAGAPREGRYVADAALGARIAERLSAAEGPVFVFAISIAAHGPFAPPDPFADWASRIARTDAMLATLAAAARRLPRPVVLLAWGDHLPSLPETAALPDWRTDWLVWHSARPGRGEARDIAAADIPREALAALAA
jgi:phosphoglycerol transferase MdoB-like AlkP superfamily enzyme